MPCRVERYLVVKSSTGVTKVVALGPKLAKKKVRAYITMKSQTDTALIWVMAAARMIRMTVMMVKPGGTHTSKVSAECTILRTSFSKALAEVRHFYYQYLRHKS